jgi:hypothetical protein
MLGDQLVRELVLPDTTSPGPEKPQVRLAQRDKVRSRDQHIRQAGITEYLVLKRPLDYSHLSVRSQGRWPIVEVDAWVLDAHPYTAWAWAAWATLSLGPPAGQAGL